MSFTAKNVQTPYHRTIDSVINGQNQFRHAINIGFVGKPKDGNLQGGYVTLTLNERNSVQVKDSIK